ncbi:MAG: gamma-glutamyl-gamma-aminobutyrate hydrolase family protein [Vicinamibacteria bacterium]|nr:gamma-glutamyl-gamma-aminobutyrate hydrolase family protein [Vicinamibacteria bacterium]
MSRKVVGLSAGFGAAGAVVLRCTYVDSISQAGAVPVILPPGAPESAADVLARLDALMITGGDDVDPALYGASAHPATTHVSRGRDDFEIALIKAALARDLPLLCICRGLQILNVALGGTLYQDIPSELPGAVRHRGDGARHEKIHDVEIAPDTLLAALLGAGCLAVNSLHHQAIRDVAPGLAVSARAIPDGIVEAVESPAQRFLLGVQWHPEEFWNREDVFRPLFDALIKA